MWMCCFGLVFRILFGFTLVNLDCLALAAACILHKSQSSLLSPLLQFALSVAASFSLVSFRCCGLLLLTSASVASSATRSTTEPPTDPYSDPSCELLCTLKCMARAWFLLPHDVIAQAVRQQPLGALQV